MKKVFFVLTLCLVLIGTLDLSIVSAEDLIKDNPLVNNIEQGQEKVDQINSASDKGEYLKREWVKFLEKDNFFSPIINLFSKIFSIINPYTYNVLGIEAILSWNLIFGLIIWATLFAFLNPVLSQMFKNGWAGLLSTFLVVSLIGLSGVIKKAVGVLSFAINNIWIAWTSLIAAIVVVMIFSRLGKGVKGYIKKSREEEAKQQTEQDRAIIHADAESTKEKLDSYKKD